MPRYKTPSEFLPSFSSAFHKETQASTVSAQRRAGFLLMQCGWERRVSSIQARCSACPARALRQSRRFLVILEGELPGGFLHKRASARELVARALRPPHRVLHTRQDWPSATVVLQVDSRSSLREW